MDHKGLLDSIGSKLQDFISTKTVVGEPITVGEVTLIPLQTASFGFGSGGGDSGKQDVGGGGGAGGGASLRPIAVIAVIGNDVRMYTVGKKAALEGLVELIPDALSKVNFGKSKEKGDKDDKNAASSEEDCCCKDEQKE